MTDADGLFTEHQRGVFRYLWRIVGQADAARDLTQEVFLRVSRTAAPVDSDAARRAWVFTIARNLGLNYVRDRGRRPEVQPLVELVQPATQELGLALSRALAALSDADRDVFLLRESAGLSYAEIAATCATTADAVRARLHRARQQLREELGRSLADHRAGGVRWT